MDIKPTSFARGVPAEERNGFYGIEQDLIEGAGGHQIVAIVTYSVDEIVQKQIAGEQYPVVKLTHIEPIHVEKDIEATLKIRDRAYKARTGMNALDLGDFDDDSRGDV